MQLFAMAASHCKPPRFLHFGLTDSYFNKNSPHGLALLLTSCWRSRQIPLCFLVTLAIQLHASSKRKLFPSYSKNLVRKAGSHLFSSCLTVSFMHSCHTNAHVTEGRISIQSGVAKPWNVHTYAIYIFQCQLRGTTGNISCDT